MYCWARVWTACPGLLCGWQFFCQSHCYTVWLAIGIILSSVCLSVTLCIVAIRVGIPVDPQADLWGPLSAGLESWWLAVGEIRLKSAGLHHKKHDWLAGLRWLFHDFCLQVPGVGDKCGTKTVINLLSNTVYCLNLFFCFDLWSMHLTVTITVGLFHLITLLASGGLHDVSLC